MYLYSFSLIPTLVVISIIIIPVIVVKKSHSKRMSTYNKLDELGSLFNIILTILYVPLSFLSIMMVMVSDVLSTNQLYNKLISIFSRITVSIPVICIICIALSVLLRIMKKSLASFLIQFIPLVIFTLNILFMICVKIVFS